MITKLDPEIIKLIRKDIDMALASIADKYKVKLNTGKCTYTDDNATIKLELATIAEGKAMTKDVTALRALKGLLGLTDTQLEHEFIMPNGTTLVAYGFLSRSDKITLGPKGGSAYTHSMSLDKFKEMLTRKGIK